MAILDASGGAGLGLGTATAAGRRESFKTSLYLLTLTFQNSAVILIMHYSRIMPMSGNHRFFTSTAVFLHEVIKLAVSLTLAIYESSKTLAPSTPATVLFEQLSNAVFARDGWVLAMPALAYTLQNLLQYVAVENLDAVHFQVLYQLKILITAVFAVFILRRPLGPKRWFALIVLTVGVTVVSLPSASSATSRSPIDSLLLHGMADHFFPRSKHELGQAASPDALAAPAAHLARRSATYEGIADDVPPPEPGMNYSLGLTCVLTAASASAIAGVYFEKILRNDGSASGGGGGVSLWIRNVQLGVYSVVAALIGGVFWQDGAGIREHGFFAGYNSVVWIAILLQSLGGLIGTLVIRDAGNIVKNFATSISIIISFLVSVWLFKFQVTATFLIGMFLVLLSTYLYNIADRGTHRPPPLHFASFEKPTIEGIFTPRSGTPRSHTPDGGSGRFNGDMLDAKGLRMTSSRPTSPVLTRQASRGNVRRDS